MQRQAPHCLRVLSASEQKILGGEWVTGTRLSGLPTVRAVVNAVIKQAYELDDPSITFERDQIRFADHWQHYQLKKNERLELGTPYPVHALISVDGIETANDVTDYMNKVFESDRRRYAKENGWLAMAAHSRSQIALDRHHPFFRYRDSLQLDFACCRFLVVDNMAVEGLNNRFLAIWGAAETFGSKRKAVQRIGRPLRTAAVRDGDVIRIPPASHDRVYIITHKAFVSHANALGIAMSTADTIADAIDFIIDMNGATQDILSIEEYVALDAAPSEAFDLDRQAQMNRWMRLRIANAIGEALLADTAPNLSELVRRFGGAGKLRRHYVRAYAESLIAGVPATFQEVREGVLVESEVDAINDLKTRILQTKPPDSSDVLEAERIAVEPMDAEAVNAWLSTSEWGQVFRGKWMGEDDSELLRACNLLYRTLEGRFDKCEFDIRQTPAARMTAIADEITRQLDVDADTAKRVQELVLEGAMHHLNRLGAATLSDFEAGGRYCKPEVTFTLRAEHFLRQLEAWICFTLLKERRLSKLWAVLRFERFWERNEQGGRG